MPKMGVVGPSKHARCLALGQQCADHLERIRQMPPGAEEEDKDDKDAKDANKEAAVLNSFKESFCI